MRHTNKPRRNLAVNTVQGDRAPKIWADLSLTAKLKKVERVSLVRLNEEFARLYQHTLSLENQIQKAAKAGNDVKVRVLIALMVRANQRIEAIGREGYRLIHVARRRDAKRLAPAQAKQAVELKATS